MDSEKKNFGYLFPNLPFRLPWQLIKISDSDKFLHIVEDFYKIFLQKLKMHVHCIPSEKAKIIIISSF